jgi:hypothetical protein
MRKDTGASDSGYCRRKAAECAIRAEQASDRDIQEFFVRMRGVWTAVAERYDLADSVEGQKLSPGKVILPS